jgi:DNA helicase-2/ATP-dependent DNA helicase PcrA
LVILTAIAQIKQQLAQGENPFASGGRNKDKPPSFVSKLALEFYPKYREELLATNCLDFDDLIYMTRELLMEYPDIRAQLHQRWSHILVDEFQDTSRIQMDLVKLLTSGSLLVVGDADQSIYSWRGAHASSLMDFEEELEGHPSGKMKTVYLMENYRSTSNIVKAAQKVISSSQESKSKSAADKIRQEMKPKRGSGPSPRVVACADAKAEGMFFCVHDTHCSGTPYHPHPSISRLCR